MSRRKKPVARSSGTIEIALPGESYVYRAYCRCGDLLYVGVAYNIFNRMANHHRTRSGWERNAVRLEWEIYPNRLEAERAERQQIRELGPIHNVRDTVPHPRWKPLPWPTMPTEEERLEHFLERVRPHLLGDRL